VYNLGSNWEYLFSQKGTLQIKSDSPWSNLNALEKDFAHDIIYRDEGVKVTRLVLKRDNYGFLHNIENLIFPNKVYILEFNKENKFSVFADTAANKAPMTSKEVLRRGDFHYCVNTSFYDEGNSALNEIIIDGKRFGKRTRSATGFFKVIDGVPYAGAPGALFSKITGKIEYSCQAFPSVIGNGELWSYILNENDKRHRKSWKLKTYRNLVGMKADGNIVSIVSGNGGLLSVREISIIARRYGLDHATLFDGGKALHYFFNDGTFRLSFSANNNQINLGPFVMQKSPIFLGVKLE